MTDEHGAEQPAPRPRAVGPRGAQPDPYAGLDAPDSAWNRAAARTTQGDPFCCRTEWALSFHETFAPHRRLRLHADGGNVLAFADGFHFRLGFLLEPVESHWLFGNPLLGTDAVALLVDWLAALAAGSERPSVLLGGVLPRSAQRRSLLAAFGDGYRIHRLQPTTLCRASLDGGLDGWLSRRSPRLRRNVRAAARKAADDGVTYERHAPTDATGSDAIYARMLAVEERSWKGIGRCGMAEPPSREFYRVMLRRLAVSGAGRVIFARHGEEDVGFVFGGVAGRVYRGQQFSYVEEWSRASIGNLLQFEQIRWLCEENASRYDMGPLMDYKRHWTERHPMLETWVLQPR